MDDDFLKKNPIKSSISRKKRINKWEVSFFILLITGLSLIIWLCIIVLQNYNDYEDRIKREEEKHYYYIVKQRRLKCMVKTLIVAYKISKWEAYYYCVIFDDFSIRYNTPWEIFAAIIRIESNFNPSAKSSSDCKGLMQIKESTAKEVAKSLNIIYNDKTLWNDILNIVLGATYLCSHIQNKGLEERVKSYLGGPDYKKSVKNNHKIHTYVKEYKASVISEYEKLALMFRGVVDEYGYTYEEIYTIPHEKDTLPLIFTLFIDSANTIKE